MKFKLAAASVYMGDEDLDADGIEEINRKYRDKLEDITTLQSVSPLDDDYDYSGYILIDIPDLSTLMKIIKVIGYDVVVGGSYGNHEEEYPYKVTIYDDYLE